MGERALPTVAELNKFSLGAGGIDTGRPLASRDEALLKVAGEPLLLGEYMDPLESDVETPWLDAYGDPDGV